MSEKTLWFFWGADADTGKSTFIRVLQAVMGDYADTVDVTVFVGKKRETSPELARLPGVRLVTATEPSMGHAWEESRIKAITGGDAIETRFLYGNPFTYEPQFKIAMVGNHEPEIRNVDDAMLRRVHIVPLDRKVPREKQIENLSAILVEREGPQILQWMVEGCAAWSAEGLQPPEIVLRKTQEYGAEEDTLQQWIDEECEMGEGFQVPREALHKSWSQWCRARGEDPGGAKAFKRRMDPKRKAFGWRDIRVGERRLQGYEGIRLRLKAEMGMEVFEV